MARPTVDALSAVGALHTDPTEFGLREVRVDSRLGELSVHVGRRQGGPATLLLHGAAGSWSTWTPLLAASDRLAHPLADIVAVDLPGWGSSGDTPAVSSVSDVTDAVVDVLKELDYTSWRVVGHSLGGVIALDLASGEPSSTLAVGLVSPSGVSLVDAIRRPLRGGVRLPGFAGMRLAMRILHAVPGHRSLLRVLHRLGILRVLSAPLFASRAEASVVDALAEEIRPQAFTRAADLLAHYDLDSWRSIRCPVRAVRGERDVFARDDDALFFGSVIADFEESRLELAGHFAHTERAEETVALLGDVWSSAAPRARGR